MVNEQVIEKSGAQVKPDVTIRIRGENLRFVSRGGEKLDGALSHFDIDCTDLIAADIGASTGGFTDCLLQRNIGKVYAIDVGYGQLAWKIRQHPKVVVMERCNARYLESLPEPVGLIVGDVSFISITKILPAMKRIAAPNALGYSDQTTRSRTNRHCRWIAKDQKFVKKPLIVSLQICGWWMSNCRSCSVIGAGAKKGVEDCVLTLSAQTIYSAHVYIHLFRMFRHATPPFLTPH